MNTKQTAFVEHYLQCWNASEAARRAGYSEKTAGSIGHELLKKPEIQDAIEARLNDLVMTTNEIMTRLTEQARGDIMQYMITRLGHAYIDMEAAQAAGKLHLIKKLTYDDDGKLKSVEFYDAQRALVELGHIAALYTDRVDITGNALPLVIVQRRDEPEPD
jgi:phage terminase small subunit